MTLNCSAALPGQLRRTPAVRCAPIDDETSCRRWRSEIRNAFTLVELLVVIAIIGVLSMAEIPDGTSNTAMVSEIRAVNDVKGAFADGRGIMHYSEGNMYQHNYTPNSLVPDEIRTSWCVTTPEAPCIGRFPSHNTRRYIVTARSNHPGGVNLLLVDSSVRFVSETISLDIWRALSTPEAVAGEPVVGEF